MKNKIVLGCFIAASMLAMPSCSDFLTENPKGKLTLKISFPIKTN